MEKNSSQRASALTGANQWVEERNRPALDHHHDLYSTLLYLCVEDSYVFTTDALAGPFYISTLRRCT